MQQKTPLPLSVVTPAYNEEESIPESLRLLWEKLDASGIDYELSWSTTNSADGTARVLDEPFRASHFNITIELSLSAIIRNYNILQVPISWQGRTWGSSNLHLREMGRRYLSTLIKIYFEKTLIRDDIIAESLAHRGRSNACSGELSSRVDALEARLAALEADSTRGT